MLVVGKAGFRAKDNVTLFPAGIVTAGATTVTVLAALPAVGCCVLLSKMVVSLLAVRLFLSLGALLRLAGRPEFGLGTLLHLAKLPALALVKPISQVSCIGVRRRPVRSTALGPANTTATPASDGSSSAGPPFFTFDYLLILNYMYLLVCNFT